MHTRCKDGTTGLGVGTDTEPVGRVEDIGTSTGPRGGTHAGEQGHIQPDSCPQSAGVPHCQRVSLAAAAVTRQGREKKRGRWRERRRKEEK